MYFFPLYAKDSLSTLFKKIKNKTNSSSPLPVGSETIRVFSGKRPTIADWSYTWGGVDLYSHSMFAIAVTM
jgi:hypothetical protein